MFTSCILLQDKFNTIASGPLWKDSMNDYAYEAIMELIEAGNSVPHKWWGKETLNKNNFILELIDATHFVMSQHLAEPFYISSDRLNEIMNEAYDDFGRDERGPLDEKSYKKVKNIIKKSIKYLLSGSDTNSVVGTWVTIMKLFKIAGISKDEIVMRYLIKNCLNKLRQDYGYKSGNYIKFFPAGENDEGIETLEDNDIMNAHILSVDIYMDFDPIYKEMEYVYNFNRLRLTTSAEKIEFLGFEKSKPIIDKLILKRNWKDVNIMDLNVWLEELKEDAWLLETSNENEC